MPSRLGLQNTPTATLQRENPQPTNECPGYNTKQSDGEVPVMLELSRTHSLPALPGPHCLGVLAPDRVLSMGRIELNRVLMLNSIV